MKQDTQSRCSGTTHGDRVEREVGEGFRMGGTHVYLWLIHVDVWQKPSQYCKYPPIKINFFFQKEYRIYQSSILLPFRCTYTYVSFLLNTWLNIILTMQASFITFHSSHIACLCTDFLFSVTISVCHFCRLCPILSHCCHVLKHLLIFSDLHCTLTVWDCPT